MGMIPTWFFRFLVDNFDDGRGQVADDKREEDGQNHLGKTPIAALPLLIVAAAPCGIAASSVAANFRLGPDFEMSL